MAKYRKKPVEIEAMQLHVGTTLQEVKEWAGEHWHPAIFSKVDNELTIYTLEGTMTATVGDWIIRGVKNEFYPCKPDIFAATYESV